MSRPLASLVAIGLAIACADPGAPTARPIEPLLVTNGAPTGPAAFQAVGALLYDFNRNGAWDGDDALCTGALIAPTVFLTAAHCVNWLPAGSALAVTFDDALYPALTPAVAAASFHYADRRSLRPSDPGDVAVVILAAGSTTGITPYQLAPAGHLDQLARRGGLIGSMFVNVGYGTTAARTGAPAFGYDGTRKVSRSRFSALNDPFVGLLMQSAATGEGGDCYGDSGGPKFVDGDLQRIVAVVSWGDRPCRGVSYNYRVDLPAARAFLAQFVTLP